ncbi:MAG TPA: FtsX-like permease family protein [Ktedonobacteraceae bacterium]|jgi:ABC-type antimicrobial peptide transport system permease subunit
MKLSLYWSYATRSLARGGQRTLLAIFCVAVGVMAIIALQLVGSSVNAALIGNIVQANGGDIRLSAGIVPLRQRDLAFLEQLKLQGHILAYAASYNPGGSITLPDGSQVVFSFFAEATNFPLVGQAHFLLPAQDLSIAGTLKGDNVVMSSSVFARLGAHIGSTYQVKTLDGRLVPITVAAEIQEDGVFRGPQVLIAQATLAAIAGPNGQPLPAAYDAVYLTVPAGQLDSVRAQLGQHFLGARIITANDLLQQRQAQVDQVRLFLRIVGLLALFIGGIGIINTMQVLLRRRQIEIAMLKTTGYRRRDLFLLFGLEAALLGLSGGLLGTGLGLGASYLVRLVVERAFMLQLPILLDPLIIASGLLIGVTTALIFGLLPIVQASGIRPLSVLREQEGPRPGVRLAHLLLLALLSVFFIFLATVVLGDLVTATIAVYGGALLVFALGAGFGLLVLAISRLPVYEQFRPRLLLWLLFALGVALLASLLCALLLLAGVQVYRLASHQGYGTVGTYALIVLGSLGLVLLGGALVYLLAALLNTLVVVLPHSWKTAVMLAYRNLGRQRLRTTTTLTALFVGVFAIGLILLLGQGIKATIDSTLNTLFTHNVFIISSPLQESNVAEQLALAQGVAADKTQVNQIVPQLYPVQVAGRDVNAVLRTLSARDQLSRRDILGDLSSLEGFTLAGEQSAPPAITLTGGRNLGPGDAGTTNVLVNTELQKSPLNLRPGDTIELQSSDGRVTRILTVVGFFDNSQLSNEPPFASMLADKGLVLQLGGSTTLDIYSLKVEPAYVPVLRKRLSQAVPSALLFSALDIDTLVNQLLSNLVIMLTTIASLAMIAGLIVIANAVALAMLERRREIGILKSVGHTSRSILAIVLIENGLVGLLGALVAMLLVAGAITALGTFVFNTPLAIGPVLVGLIILASTLLTMFVAMGVAWRAVRVRPLDVLRYE